MQNTDYRAIAIVGAGAILPDAPNVPAFWKNIKAGRYSISEVTPDRWDPALYFDADHNAPDKTYSKIGGWVREYPWEPLKWRMAIPPCVVDAMDESQRWAIAATREALADYGYPERPLNTERTAVILGNAMAGERHYLTVDARVLPGIRTGVGGKRHIRRSARRGPAGTLHANGGPASETGFLRSRKTACPANWRTAWLGGSPTFTTSAARTSLVTRRAHPPWPRSTRL